MGEVLAGVPFAPSVEGRGGKIGLSLGLSSRGSLEEGGIGWVVPGHAPEVAEGEVEFFGCEHAGCR